jgi:hypothetical protein
MLKKVYKTGFKLTKKSVKKNEILFTIDRYLYFYIVKELKNIN